MQVRRARPDEALDGGPRHEPGRRARHQPRLARRPGKRWQSAEQMADKIDAILVKLGQPSGPAPLKRWLETLSARDGAKPPVAARRPVDRSEHRRRSGQHGLELEEVASTAVEQDRGTGLDTRPLRARPRARRAEPAHVVGPVMGPPDWRRRTGPASPGRHSRARGGGFKRRDCRRQDQCRAVVNRRGAVGADLRYFRPPHLPVLGQAADRQHGLRNSTRRSKARPTPPLNFPRSGATAASARPVATTDRTRLRCTDGERNDKLPALLS
jgi:hypothetical protein